MSLQAVGMGLVGGQQQVAYDQQLFTRVWVVLHAPNHEGVEAKAAYRTKAAAEDVVALLKRFDAPGELTVVELRVN